MMTMSELMRRTYGNGMAQTPYVEEVNTPRLAIEDIPTRRISKGNGKIIILYIVDIIVGDWRNQIEHITAHLYNVARDDKYFQRNLGEPQLGEVCWIVFMIFLLNTISKQTDIHLTAFL